MLDAGRNYTISKGAPEYPGEGSEITAAQDADYATIHGRNPMGNYFEPHEKYSHIRVGPDWSSFVINWMTRWERFEDEKYRDKLLHSIDSLKKAPLRMASGSTFHYDPTTGEMHYMGAPNIAEHEHLGDGNYQQHMVICFGGPETWFELVDLLEDDEFSGMFEYLTPDYHRGRRPHPDFRMIRPWVALPEALLPVAPLSVAASVTTRTEPGSPSCTFF